MATLTEQQKEFIVIRLAMHDSVKMVTKAFAEEYGQTLDRKQVWQYDVDKCRNRISKRLVALFDLTRKKFEDDVSSIPIAQRSFRLRRLQQIHDGLMDKGNVLGAAQILEQAAKEAGDAFTNTVNLKGKVKHEAAEEDFSAVAKRATLSDLIEQAMRKTAPPGEVQH